MYEKYRAGEKQRHIEQWKASGKSGATYAAEQGIAQSTFSKWVIADRNTSSGGFLTDSREIKNQDNEKPRFVEIKATTFFTDQKNTIKDCIITIRKKVLKLTYRSAQASSYLKRYSKQRRPYDD